MTSGCGTQTTCPKAAAVSARNQSCIYMLDGSPWASASSRRARFISTVQPVTCVLHQQPGKLRCVHVPALMPEKALVQQLSFCIYHLCVAVDQQGRSASPSEAPRPSWRQGRPASVRGSSGRPDRTGRYSPLWLVPADSRSCPTAPCTRCGLSSCTTENRASFAARILQEGGGAVRRAVVLHQHAEVYALLRRQRFQLLRQVFFTVVTGQQYLDHHFHPHLWKYLKMDLSVPADCP